MQTLEPSPYQESEPMEKYIDSKMKKFNKDALIDLAREGMYKNLNYRHRVIPKKKNIQNLYASPLESPSAIKN